MGLSEKLTEAKSEIDSLITYANGVTGESDTSIGDAILTLCDGYGSGSAETDLGQDVMNLEGAIEDKYLNYGTESNYNGWKISGYIHLKRGSYFSNNFSINKNYCAMYDMEYTKKKNALDIAISGFFSVNEECYIRMSAVSSSINNFHIIRTSDNVLYGTI